MQPRRESHRSLRGCAVLGETHSQWVKLHRRTQCAAFSLPIFPPNRLNFRLSLPRRRFFGLSAGPPAPGMASNREQGRSYLLRRIIARHLSGPACRVFLCEHWRFVCLCESCLVRPIRRDLERSPGSHFRFKPSNSSPRGDRATGHTATSMVHSPQPRAAFTASTARGLGMMPRSAFNAILRCAPLFAAPNSLG
jgi:hypothetical protein